MHITDTHLGDHRADPDAEEDRIASETLEHITLTVDLSCVDLVEECHHDECIEDNSEVLRWLRESTGLVHTTAVYVEYTFTYIT